MNGERLLLDTGFIQAVLSSKDKYHRKAISLMPRIRAATEVWVTEAGLIESANTLSSLNRLGVEKFIRNCFRTANIRVIPVDTSRFVRGLDLYRARSDKEWSLTDCISFHVMEKHGLADAVTADVHFVQAGFRALMLDN